MAADNQFLRIKKLTGKGIVRTAMRHNLREIQSELGADSHIDATRSTLNAVLAGEDGAGDVSEYADTLMQQAGVKTLRKDAVRALEIVVSLRPMATINQSAFFGDALAWVEQFYKSPVLSAVVHHDEATPHCHILILPLIDGRMKGSDIVGNRTRMQAMQTSFYELVGSKHGLTRPKQPRRASAATRAKGAELVLTALQSNPDLLFRADIQQAFLAMRDPEPMLSALGLSMPHPPKSKKSLVEIMTKPCKPEKPIGFNARSSPIGFDNRGAEKEQTLSCVGFALQKPPVSSPERTESPCPATSPPDLANEYQRTRDDAQDAAQWDSDRGEFIAIRQASQSATILHRWAA